MPCTPLDESQFSPPNASGINGFATPQSPLNIPFGPVDAPDLSILYEIIQMITPIGIIKPNFEPDFLNDVYGGISSVLSHFMPFLMVYRFFLPALNLILCIIEVICALLNPFKLIRAVQRLFRQCIPEFLALFPNFALGIIIISLLELIQNLIEALLARIITMLLILIENIIALGRAVQRLENDSIVAIIKKVGDLLCFLQNLFIIFNFIALIIQVIQAILTLIFKIPPCDDSDGTSDGCCTTDVCPDFIKNNETITSNTGIFLYYNQVGIDSGLVLPAGFPPIVSTIRNESWQFYDPGLTQRQAFINITNAYDLPEGTTKVFFPPGASYNSSSDPNSAPYTIDFRFFYNPAAFNISDPKGARFLKIVNAIVQNPPVAGISSFDNSIIPPLNGTLNLVGGLVTEDNGAVILNAQGMPTNINAFIHLPVNNSGVLINNGILFENLTYEFNINHEILAGSALITLGCIPEVAADKNFINSTIGAQFNMNGTKLGAISNTLPDVNGAQECITNAITTFRQNISVQTANEFQTTITNCLNTLSDQTTSSIANTIAAGFDQYKSSFSLDTNIQFTTAPIHVLVSINESSGQLTTTNLPVNSAVVLAPEITGVATLGSLSNFTYDGYNFFVAELTSDVPGNGMIKVAFQNNFISILNNPASIDESPSVVVKELPYTFVESTILDNSQVRRDAGDVARDNIGGGN